MLVGIFDIETTGFSPIRHQILEIGAVVIDLDNLDATPAPDFEIKISYPEMVVESGAMPANQIDLRDWPGLAPAAALNEMSNWIKSWSNDKYPVVGGHNITKFDGPFLLHFAQAHAGRTAPLQFSHHMLDTVQIAFYLRAKKKLPSDQSLSLQPLCDYFGIPTFGDAHRALPDAKRTVALLKKMLAL
jgi:DNA polymerase III epsilon subunit-like protein